MSDALLWRRRPTAAAEPSHHDQQVSVGPGEHGNVHGDAQRVRLVQTDAEVPLPAQQQQDEDADVHETHASCKQGPVVNVCGARRPRRQSGTHTDRPWRRSGRRGWGPACPARRCSSERRTGTSTRQRSNQVQARDRGRVLSRCRRGFNSLVSSVSTEWRLH